MKITKETVKAKKCKLAKGWKYEAVIENTRMVFKDVFSEGLAGNYKEIATPKGRQRGIVLPPSEIEKLVDNAAKDELKLIVIPFAKHGENDEVHSLSNKPKRFKFTIGETFWVKEKWLHGICPNDIAGVSQVFDNENNGKYAFWRKHKNSPPESISWARMWERKPAYRMPKWASRFSLKVHDYSYSRSGPVWCIWALVKIVDNTND